MTYKYELNKCSVPGFTFQTDDLPTLRWLLDKHICESCKTQHEGENAMFDMDMDVYNGTDDLKAIHEGLYSPCGCEFRLEIRNEIQNN